MKHLAAFAGTPRTLVPGKFSCAFCALLVFATGTWGADDTFVPLFNGRDLTGWVNANCAPETWSVRDGVIHCTGRPTGALRTSRHYENFILEVEWRHLSSGGNSGIFIWGTPIAAPGVPFLRGIEVQVLDHGYSAAGKNEWYTTHGDVFPIHGATMKPFGRHNGMRSFPSEERSNPSPAWNHYRIVGSNGVLRLTVNGKEVSGGEECNYRKGYLALESEGAPVEFRNLRIQELPSTQTPAALTAPLDEGWRSLFTGLDLRGWKTNAATARTWRAGGERLNQNRGPGNAEATLWTTGEFGDAQFVFDCRVSKPAENDPPAVPAVTLRAGEGSTGTGAGLVVRLPGLPPGQHQRVTITVKGRDVTVQHGDRTTQQLMLPENGPVRGRLGLVDTGAGADFMNLYARDL